ncbi:hypothetical protein Gorai_009764, partial [Gossypium raimondii]|nr:hypothetical protein [Gossypium raimondii]
CREAVESIDHIFRECLTTTEKTLIGADVKINFDVAFDLNQARSGPWVVARNARDSPDKSLTGSIIRDIQHYKHHFRRISFNHKPRSENCPAHTLATQGLRKGEDVYLEGGLPEFVRRVLERRSLREPD